MDSFWRDAWTSFRAVAVPLATAAALVLALLGSFWDPGGKVQIGSLWLAVFGLVILAIVVTAINMAVTGHRLARAGPPKAIHVFVAPPAEDESAGPITLVLQRSDLFGVNILVTIYYVEAIGPGQEDVFERSIGIGRVANIQENGRLQEQVLKEDSNHAELWRRIRNREMAIVGQIVVKPSIDLNVAGIEVLFDE